MSQRPDPLAQFRPTNAADVAQAILEPQEGDDVDRKNVACGCVLAMIVFVAGVGVGVFLRTILSALSALL